MLQFLFCYTGDALTAASMGIFMVSYWLDICRVDLKARRVKQTDCVTQE